MIITEIILNGNYDITNTILNSFEKNGNLKIPQGFDFNTVLTTSKKVVLKELFIEYVNNEEIHSEKFMLSNGKIMKKINIPSVLERCFYCFFMHKIVVEDYDKLLHLLEENKDKENIALIFNIENNTNKLKNYSDNFDYIINISVNEKTFEMKYSKGTLSKIVGKLTHEEKFYCFNLTPYFVYRYVYDVLKVRCNILYFVNSKFDILGNDSNKNDLVLSNGPKTPKPLL